MAQGAGVSTARRRAGAVCLVLSVIFGVVSLRVPVASAATSVAITSATGPLKLIEISETLSCKVVHAADELPTPVSSFFGDNACGTFLAAGGQVYGPSGIATLPGAIVAFTPYRQTKSGSGTLLDPFRIETVVTTTDGAFTVTETDMYVEGQETYRTDVSVTNRSGSDATVTVYRAGDCTLRKSDSGFGRFDGFGPAVACVGHMLNANPPPTRIPSSAVLGSPG